MHEVSNETLRSARRRALLAKQHGKRTQSTANRLWQAGCITEIQREQIESCVELMQQFAQGMLDAIEAAYKCPKQSAKAYGLAIEHHVQVNQYHMLANRLLIEYRSGIAKL